MIPQLKLMCSQGWEPLGQALSKGLPALKFTKAGPLTRSLTQTHLWAMGWKAILGASPGA